MFFVDWLILLTAVLLILGIVSSKFSARVGLPVLVLFLFVGMLAGSEGVGGIVFENYPLAHGIGTIALAFILFDGGLRTEVRGRAQLEPPLVLATLGVVLTAALVGVAAMLFMGLDPVQAFLFGSIVGSTDAAAVFAVFRSKGLKVRERVATTLEIESGANDPMALFLTVLFIEILLGDLDPGPGIIWRFVAQMGLGALIGWLVGLAATTIINRIRLDAAGLYPVLTGAAALLAYGGAAMAGGSGFLAVYVAGIVVGSRRLVFRRGVLVFHDGLAWLSQIALFVVLGLLSSPSGLLAEAAPGLLIAGALVFVARPVAVGVCLLPFHFSVREMVLIAWGGLKGAVPIVLATYPFMMGLAGAETLFNGVFFVVLVSAISQGWTLPWAAGKLGLREPVDPEPPVTLEVTSLRDVDGDIVEYTLTNDSRVVGRRVRELAFPEGAVIGMIVRGQTIIPPRGSTPLRAGDHVFVLLRPEVRPLIERVLGGGPTDSVPTSTDAVFPLRGSARLGELSDFYGLHIDAPPNLSIRAFLTERLGGEPEIGRYVSIGSIKLTVQEIVNGRIETVGLSIDPDAAESESPEG